MRKINWTLDVVGTLPASYHDLDMLMQSVTLCDQMTIEEAPGFLSLSARTGGRSFRTETTSSLRAAAALQSATGCTRAAHHPAQEYIPRRGRHGRRKQHAAAALVGLNRLWGLGLGETSWKKIGLTIGADVPFCIRGGLQRAQGIGEKLTRLEMKKPLYLVAFHAAGFRPAMSSVRFMRRHQAGGQTGQRAAQKALAGGDVRALDPALGNVLEPVSVRRMMTALSRAIEDT